ncbi:uncharacterized protein C3orf22 homolog [Oryctolagus cuniculus]|uniref:Thioredoxin reductase 3 n=1 Tax=Oryctolagus cuniculus TaxID=9986 RepID=A0A5F9CHA3_RABIT|nr:uncharacterized protein C3orf22 homolog [Oryctolagus cuniculus]XP_051707747.1 uncharacterized protein C3orf22 homolog [Oryctolagus cuniculus]
MDLKAPRKPRQLNKSRTKAQERFAKNFPYRLSWLSEPSSESPKPWEAKSTPQREKLPLQKNLVPTRSIPVRGLGAPDFTGPLGSCLPPSPPLQPRLCNLWELKLLQCRFPKQLSHKLWLLHARATHSCTNEAAGPSRGLA